MLRPQHLFIERTEGGGAMRHAFSLYLFRIYSFRVHEDAVYMPLVATYFLFILIYLMVLFVLAAFFSLEQEYWRDSREVCLSWDLTARSFNFSTAYNEGYISAAIVQHESSHNSKVDYSTFK
jgi:hypothetical protein